MDYGDGTSQSYAFDAMGDRLSRQDSAAGATNYGYNAANMLTGSTGAGGSSYTNDADGDTLSGGGRTMTWDAQHRMTSCTVNGSTATFTSGADGLRRSMTVNGVTTYYVYDGQSLVREMQGAPGSLRPTATYLAGPRGPEYRRDDTRQETDGQGHTYGVTRWYVYDGLGSVVGEVDPAGNVTCADEYDVYGAVRGRAGTASTAHGFVGSLGHFSDAATGLVYMRARYYDPSTGRFASEDPAYSGTNWFIYTHDNPVNRVDGTGKDDLADVLFSTGEANGLDGSLGGLGLKSLGESIIDVYDTNAGVFLDNVESIGGPGSGTFNKELFVNLLRLFAKANDQSIIQIYGETAGDASGGAKLNRALVDCIKALGDNADISNLGDGVQEIYWTITDG